jgi:HEAT repeat protein
MGCSASGLPDTSTRQGPAAPDRAPVLPPPGTRPLVIPPGGFGLGPGQDPAAVPAGARVTLEADEGEYFVGEAVPLRLVLSNGGDDPFPWCAGPEHGGVHVRATHEDGREAAAPGVDGTWTGGLVRPAEDLPPGFSASVRFDLGRHCRIDRPGTWFLEAGHDFGWTPEPGRPIPVATLRLRFLECPDPEALRRVEEVLSDPEADPSVLAEAKHLPYLERRARTSAGPFWSWGRAGSRAVEAIGALARRDPGIALPALERMARGGDGRALDALERVPSPAATRILVGLLDAAPPELLEDDPDAVAWALLARIPTPRGGEGSYFYGARGTEEEIRALRATWDPALAPAVRAWAVKRLEGREPSDWSTLPFQVLQCIGQPEDAPAFRAGLRRWIDGIPSLPTEEKQGIAIEKAAEVLAGYFALSDPPPRIPVPPRDLLEILEFLHAIRPEWDEDGDVKARKPLPPGGEAVLLDLLRHPLPFVRQRAAWSCPVPVPASVRERIPGLLEDASPDVRSLACGIAEESGDPSLVDLLIRRIREDPDIWVVSSAHRAGSGLGERDACSRALATLLRPGDPRRLGALQRLAWAYLEGLGEVGGGEPLPAADADWEPLEGRWNRFLDAVRGRPGPRDKVPLSDPSVTADLLGGVLRFRLADGTVFPGRALPPR